MKLKVGDVVRFQKGVFGIIQEIHTTDEVIEDQCLSEDQDERDYIDLAFPDGFVYVLDDGGNHYGGGNLYGGNYARDDFSKAYLGIKSIRDEYVLWKLEQ